jgi:hypothetical protein
MLAYRKLMLSLTALYLAITLLNYLFIESIWESSSYMPYARGFMVTFYALLFLYCYFQLDSLSLERFWRPLLWITVGIVIFYPVVSISIGFQKQILATGILINGVKLYNLIPQVMSIFMYGCFTYAFHLCKKIS